MAWWTTQSSSGDSVSSRKRAGRRNRRRHQKPDLRDCRDFELYYGGKGKKPRIWFMQNSMRFMAALMFVFLLLYEVFVLKKSTSIDVDEGVRDGNMQKERAGFKGDRERLRTKNSWEQESVHNGDFTQPRSFTSNSSEETGEKNSVSDSYRASNERRVSQHAPTQKFDYSHSQESREEQQYHPPHSSTYQDDTTSYKPPDHQIESQNSGMHEQAHSAHYQRSEQLPQQPDARAHHVEDDAQSNANSQYATRNYPPRRSSAQEEGAQSQEERAPLQEETGKIEDGSSDDQESQSNSKGPPTKASDDTFWKWFQDSKKNEGKGASTVSCPDDYKRLCQMFYKILKKHKIRKVFDISCVKNLRWMPSILSKVSNELWGFEYHCNDADDGEIQKAKMVLQDFSFAQFHTRQWWKSGFPETLDLVFAWDVLSHTAYGRVWSFFVHVRKQRVKYTLFDNYPGIMNDPSPKRYFINVRKHPFKFPAARDVIQNVTEPGETAKRQLLFYESDMLPEHLGV